MPRLMGQSLLEIFEVSADFPFVGIIVVCDDFSCKTLFRRDNWSQACNKFTSRKEGGSLGWKPAKNFKDKLVLSGPCRAATADCRPVIKAYMFGTRKKSAEASELFVNSDDSKLYSVMQTYTMKTDRGSLYVTCSVFPEALQGCIDITVQVEHSTDLGDGATVSGLITARIGKFKISSTLFQRGILESVPLEVPLNAPCNPRRGYQCMRVPLTRSVLALPLGETLDIKGTLLIHSHDWCSQPIYVDHSINIEQEVCTGFSSGVYGNQFTSVTMSLGPIF